MTSISDLRPGDIGFGPISGAVGLGISLGQLALGEGFHVGQLDIRHVFVVTTVDPAEAPTSGGRTVVRVVEARPGGAEEVWATRRWTPQYAYVRPPEDYPGQGADAAAIAVAMVGTPYSFASYAALAAWKWGLSTPRLERWINRRRPVFWINSGGQSMAGPVGHRVELPAEAICSVLADQAWSLTGKKIMEGVPHQCVTPGALAGRLLTMDGARWLFPGEAR